MLKRICREVTCPREEKRDMPESKEDFVALGVSWWYLALLLISGSFVDYKEVVETAWVCGLPWSIDT